MHEENNTEFLIEIEARGYTKEDAIRNVKKALHAINSNNQIWFTSERDTDGLLAYHIEIRETRRK